MSEYQVLSNKIEKANEILSQKYEVDIWAEHFENVINGKRCVYDRSKDSRRYPTPEEIKKASSDLALQRHKIEVLDAQFAAL